MRISYCISDVFSSDLAPPLKREFYQNWQDGEWPLIFRQDFANVAEVQKGLKSRAFSGSRTNPVQERAISNFHRRLREFLRDTPGVNRSSVRRADVWPGH